MNKDLECATCREMNVAEEIEALPIDEKIKERIVKKAKADMDNTCDLYDALARCHDRIYALEKACIELSIMVAMERKTI